MCLYYFLQLLIKNYNRLSVGKTHDQLSRHSNSRPLKLRNKGSHALNDAIRFF